MSHHSHQLQRWQRIDAERDFDENSKSVGTHWRKVSRVRHD